MFRTRSNSEIALHLYESQGARSLHSLRGEFAYAIWDERDSLLFAARDRFGIKPLYYTIHDGTFYLASEVKAFADLGAPIRWDLETLYDVHFVCVAAAGSARVGGPAAALEEAVRLRLRADVPVACYPSGGIDSCAVLGFASRLSPRPLRAYTLSFDHADYDERAIAEERRDLRGLSTLPPRHGAVWRERRRSTA